MVVKVAAGALLARYWPKGSRHLAALALAGALLRSGWTEDEAERFVYEVARAARDEEAESRRADVRSTARKLAAGEPATGQKTCIEIFGERVWQRLREWLDLRRSSESRDAAAPYRETDSGLVRLEVRGGPDHQVEIEHPLTNFNARIVGDVSRDDGAESTRAFEIEARLGERLRTFMVPASQFGGMRWVTEQLGAQAVVYAGQATADHARTAIQLLSRDPISRTVYTHTGWRKLSNAWVYLHGGGAIGVAGAVDGVEVSLPPELAAFKLGLPADRVAAIRASLQLLGLGPDRITVPAYGVIWRSILQGTDFSSFLYGPTGAFKTQLGALIQAHHLHGKYQ